MWNKLVQGIWVAAAMVALVGVPAIASAKSQLTHGTSRSKMTHGTSKSKMTHGTNKSKMTHGHPSSFGGTQKTDKNKSDSRK